MAHKPISMRCTAEQFEEIKPILEANGCIIKSLSNFDLCPHLVNDYNFKKEITNFADVPYCYTERHEEWNDQIFLDACGITTSKSKPIEPENQYDVASRIVAIFKRLQHGMLTPLAAGELIAAEIEAYAEIKVLANHKAEHGNTWDAAIKAHEERGGNVARTWSDFDEYYKTTFKGGENV
jgi:hypothetical protein